MVDAMQPGSVIVDMAVSTGGNVEGSKNDEYVFDNGVTIIGMSIAERLLEMLRKYLEIIFLI